jgi:predicted nucleotidyltransferase
VCAESPNNGAKPMREPFAVPHDLLVPISQVVEAALRRIDGLQPGRLMVVGAWCRDIWHDALGHEFRTAATQDLDLAIAVDSWTTIEAIADAFPRVGDSGIRFLIADLKVDVLPFGEIEDPVGTSEPPTRGEGMSVWAFTEVFAASTSLDLGEVGTVRLPTVPGYAATKLAAWLDRSEWNETKDASDIALVTHWYAESPEIHDRLYDSEAGQAALVSEELDVTRAAAHLLGLDVVAEIGSERMAELRERWPDGGGTLARDLIVRAGPRSGDAIDRRTALAAALTRGLHGSVSEA